MNASESLTLAARLWVQGRVRESLVVLGAQFAPTDTRSKISVMLRALPDVIRKPRPTLGRQVVEDALNAEAISFTLPPDEDQLRSIARQFLEQTRVIEALRPFEKETANALRRPNDSTCLRIAVLGTFSCGKSSLLNALLGEDVLATGLIPVTAAMTVIQYGDNPVATWTHADGSEVSATLGQAIANTDNRVAHDTTVIRVSLQLPLPLLRRFTFIDTPGLDSGFEHHDAAFHDVITSSDAVLWLFNATRPGSESDRIGLSAAQSQTGLTVGLVNQIDAIRPSPDRRPERWKKEVDGVVEDLQATFGNRIQQWIPTSSVWIESGDPRGGLAEIEAALTSIESAKNAIQVRAKRQTLEIAARRGIALARIQRRELDASQANIRELEATGEGLLKQAADDWQEEVALASRRNQPEQPLPTPTRTVRALLSALLPSLLRPSDRESIDMTAEQRQGLYDAVVALEAHSWLCRLGSGPETTWMNTVAQVWNRQNRWPPPSPWIPATHHDYSKQVRDLLVTPRNVDSFPTGSIHTLQPPALTQPWRVVEFLGPTGEELAKHVATTLPTPSALTDRLLLPKSVRAHVASLRSNQAVPDTRTTHAFNTSGVPGVDRLLRRQRLKRLAFGSVVLGLGAVGTAYAVQEPQTQHALVEQLRAGLSHGTALVRSLRQDSSEAAASSIHLAPGFVTVPAGTDRLGSPATEPGRQSDESASDVTFNRPFQIMTTEVTQGEWVELMGENPNVTRTRAWPNPSADPCDTVGVGADLPVTCVSWNDAVLYANALSQRAGLSEAYTVNGGTVTWVEGSRGYRLPTEAEWEYAARAGLDGAWGLSSMDCSVAKSVETCSASLATPTLRTVDHGYPNPWGLHNTVGNAWEWTWDWYAEYPAQRDNYAGPPRGSTRTLRGGSGINAHHIMRLANRYDMEPHAQSEWVGFRLARTLPEPQ